MSDKYITEYVEETTPSSTDALLLDKGSGAYKYCQIANLLKGINLSGLGTISSGAITSSGNFNLLTAGADIALAGRNTALTKRGFQLSQTNAQNPVGALSLFDSSGTETRKIYLEGFTGNITASGKIETTSTATDSIKTAGGVSVAGELTRNLTVSDNPKYPDVIKRNTNGVAKVYNTGTAVIAAASAGDLVVKVIDDVHFTATRTRENFTGLLIAHTLGAIRDSYGSQILRISGTVENATFKALKIDVISTDVNDYISAQTWAIGVSGTNPGTIELTTNITNSNGSSGLNCTTTIYGDIVYHGRN
jgi:hypothetical protein